MKLYEIERYDQRANRRQVVLKLPSLKLAWQVARFLDWISWKYDDFYTVKPKGKHEA